MPRRDAQSGGASPRSPADGRRRSGARPQLSPAPGPEAERQQALYLLRRLTTDVDAFARGFGATHGLHAHDVRALVLLIDAARTGTPMGPGALGAQLGLSSASTTALLDRLEHAGHVSRRPHPGDRRKVIVEPTTHALDEGRRWFGAMNLDMLAVLERFDDAEVAVLLRVLEGLTATVQEHLDARPEPPPDAPDRR